MFISNIFLCAKRILKHKNFIRNFKGKSFIVLTILWFLSIWHLTWKTFNLTLILIWFELCRVKKLIIDIIHETFLSKSFKFVLRTHKKRSLLFPFIGVWIHIKKWMSHWHFIELFWASRRLSRIEYDPETRSLAILTLVCCCKYTKIYSLWPKKMVH